MLSLYSNTSPSVCHTESVIIAIREAMTQISGARTIDCAMNYAPLFDKLFLFKGDLSPLIWYE